ncbi:MAG TPA: hypothetical protein VMH87_05265, partial [Pseudomonadales bacterium]|nr:hypothetical protein [Pseudomonadales bacterium]
MKYRKSAASLLAVFFMVVAGMSLTFKSSAQSYITNVISTFPSGFGLSGYYASWTTATKSDTGQGFQVVSSTYGSGYYGLSTPFRAPGATLAQLTFTLVSPSGYFGVPFTMTDGSGNQVTMAGGPNGNAYASISPGTYTWTVPVGSLNVSNVTAFNLEFDPVSYSGSYTIIYNKIALLTPLSQVAWNAPSSIVYGAPLDTN